MTSRRSIWTAGLLVVVLAGAVAGSAVSSADTVAAGNPGLGSAYSATAQVTPTSGITTTTSVKLLGSIDANTITKNVVTPLVTALTALPTQVSANLTAGLVSAGLSAQSSSTGLGPTRPASGYPTCSASGWSSSNCYGPVVPTIAASPALGLTVGAVQGYATGDVQGYIGAARVSHPNLSLLGLNVGDLGLVDSSAVCSTMSGTCSTTQSLTGGSLLGGKLTFSVANGALAASIAGTPVTGTAIAVPGTTSTVSLNGNLLKLTIGLNLTQLLAALGLPNLLSALGSLAVLSDNATTASLTVTIGPGDAALSANRASAWGLAVTASLTADIELKAALLVPLATISVTAGGSNPNLMDLKLAYSSAALGWVPPALI